MIDLKDLDTKVSADEGAVLDLIHPVKFTPLNILIRLVGADSDMCNKARRKLANKRIKQRNRKAVTIEELEEEAIDLLVGCTLGWENVMYNGEALEFTKENVRKLYVENAWIREQVDEFIGDRANFLLA